MHTPVQYVQNTWLMCTRQDTICTKQLTDVYTLVQHVQNEIKYVYISVQHVQNVHNVEKYYTIFFLFKFC